MVRVLVLVDEDVAEGLLPLLLRVRMLLEHLDGAHDQVVEVHRVRGVQTALVAVVDGGHGLLVEGADALRVLLRADELVLGVGDLVVDAARDEALRIPALLLDDRLDDTHLVGLVVDREVRPVGKPRRLAAEDAPAGGVEGHHPHALGDVAEDGLEAALHLPGGLVREGDGEDLVRLHAARRDRDARCGG